MKRELSAERLRELLHYDPQTGVFRWVADRHSGIKAGDAAGSPTDRGYTVIGIEGEVYRAHRLAWLYMTGEWSPSEIDHRNLVKDDNAWDNLRLSNRSLNLQNQTKAMKNNHTGLLGVTKRRDRVFIARIRLDGKSTFLGQFETPERAHAAYLEAKRELHPGSVA